MTQHKREQSDPLTEKMSSLEHQLRRIGDLLEAQVAGAKSRQSSWRWRPSLRTLFVMIGVLALGVAWFTAEYRQSRLQSRAIEVLLDQRALFFFEPSESILVGMLPGKSSEPPAALVRALGHDFFNRLRQVSIVGTPRFQQEPDEILDGLALVPGLRAVRISQLPLTTGQLRSVFQLKQLESLDVSRTGLDNGSIEEIQNTSIRWLDCSHTRLGNIAASELSRCEELEYLNLERTAVSDAGIEYLAKLKGLRHLILRRTPVSPLGVQKLADQLPNCYIEYQPLVFRNDGTVDVQACRRGSLVFGDPPPVDPRQGQTASAPLGVGRNKYLKTIVWDPSAAAPRGYVLPNFR